MKALATSEVITIETGKAMEELRFPDGLLKTQNGTDTVNEIIHNWAMRNRLHLNNVDEGICDNFKCRKILNLMIKVVTESIRITKTLQSGMEEKDKRLG